MMYRICAAIFQSAAAAKSDSQMEKVKSFLPVIDVNAKVLILGSMPGEQSRRQKQYYANKRNHFWPIIYTFFAAAEEAAGASYEAKLLLAQKNGVALWDVIGTCLQKNGGSSDATLAEAQANDFAALFAAYPGIRHVFFNGAKAYEIFRRQIGFKAFPGVMFYKLTSTSPANTLTLEKKLAEWELVKMKLEEEKKTRAPELRRLVIVQKALLALLADLEAEPLERDESLDWERLHLASCARTGQLLALKRGVDLELAGIACAVHDYGRIISGKQKDHAANGYEPVKKFLAQCAPFTEEEIEMIAAAVREHSSKSIVGTALEEIVKDADVLDCHLYGLPMARAEQQERLEKMLQQL